MLSTFLCRLLMLKKPWIKESNDTRHVDQVGDPFLNHRGAQDAGSLGTALHRHRLFYNVNNAAHHQTDAPASVGVHYDLQRIAFFLGRQSEELCKPDERHDPPTVLHDFLTAGAFELRHGE